MPGTPTQFFDPTVASDNLRGIENRFRTITGIPPNLTLTPTENDTHIRIGLTYRQSQLKGVGVWRVFYLDASLVSAADLFAPTEFTIGEGGEIDYTKGFFSAAQGKQKWVIDIPNSGTVTSASVSAAPYSNGGWFYAIGVDASGHEYPSFATPPVNIPAAVVTGPNVGPLFDVTSQSVSLTHKTKQGEFLDTVACTYNAPDLFGGFAGVTIAIFNNFNLGTLQEVQFFQFQGEGPGTQGGATFDILRDDGSNGGTPPGAHTVTIYFLAQNRMGGRINRDYTLSPSFVLANGFN